MNRAFLNLITPFATAKQLEKLELSYELGSSTAAAAKLGIDRRGVDRAIEAVIKKATEEGALMDEPDNLKVLLLDIETAPMLGYFWRLWSEIRGIDQIERDWYMFSYAYKWLGNEEVYGKSLYECEKYGPYTAGSEDDRELTEDLWTLMNDADILVAHNGDNFDIKKIKARMLQHVMIPPAPYRTVDTLKILKREFGLTSNKLDYAARFLLGEKEGKLATGGLQLWKDCLAGVKAAWQHMLTYNKEDVSILEKVYLRVRAWDRSHPNVAVLSGSDERQCTVCGSHDVHIIEDKFAATNVSVFEAYRCHAPSCGHVMRGRKNQRSKEALRETVLNAR